MAIATQLTDLPLTFRLSEEQELIRETIAEIAQKEFAPRAAEIDRDHRFPRENWDLLAASDVCGLVFPEQYGGAGLDAVCYAIVVEELAKACATTSVMYSAHVSLCAKPIYIFGTEEQKQRWLVPMCQGKKMGAFALSEPGSGSDSAAATCMAIRDGDNFILNGSKNWITNGVEADYYLVIA
ncbi:MAG TPA: acyl-CoA dehydrogenase family protein, partial [Chroococcales cyanobacterium]